jgi:hypothetical protein
MQLDGIRADQVTQVRGFADRRLRKKEDPLDAANRRISLTVQYLSRPEPLAGAAGKPEEKPTETHGEKKTTSSCAARGRQETGMNFAQLASAG